MVENPKLQTYEPSMLDHLFTDDERAREALLVEILKKYQPTDRDDILERQFRRLVASVARHDIARAKGADFLVGSLAENRIMWLVGPPGVGKTRALLRLFRSHFPTYRVEGEYCPLITVNAQSPFTLAEFARGIVEAATGVEPQKDLKEKTAVRLARAALRDRIKFLHVDEAQNMIETRNPVEIDRARNMIRSLVQDLRFPIAMIFSGKESSLSMGNFDSQIGRRRSVVRFEEMDDATSVPVLRGMMANYADKAKLRLHAELDCHDFFERLIHASMRRFGIAAEYLQDAIAEAFEHSHDELGIAHFELVYMYRTACAYDSNVFTMQHWRGENVELASERTKPEGSVGGRSPARRSRTR